MSLDAGSDDGARRRGHGEFGCILAIPAGIDGEGLDERPATLIAMVPRLMVMCALTRRAVEVTHQCLIGHIPSATLGTGPACGWGMAVPRFHFRLLFMTGIRVSSGVVSLAACLMLWTVLAVNAYGQDAGSQSEVALAGSPHQDPLPSPIHIDLPAEPLAEALKAYGRMTDLLVMADVKLLDARTSAPVKGDFSAAEALRRLLVGTGLDARFTSEDSAVIVPLSGAAAPQAAAASAPETIPASAIDGLGADASYATLIQTRLTEALCESPLTRLGNYRIVVQMLIDDTGAVKASKIVDSTGDADRDAAIARTVHDLVFDYAPPPTLRQPVTILLRPQNGGVASGCAQTGGQG